MPERITAMLQLLEESRDAQAKANEMLGEVRVDVAGMKRTLEAQQESMADLRRQQTENSERLRAVELTLARLPQHERDLGRLFGKHQDLETRVRTLEGDGRETKLVNGAVKGGAREVFKHMISVVAGALGAALAWALSKGG